MQTSWVGISLTAVESKSREKVLGRQTTSDGESTGDTYGPIDTKLLSTTLPTTVWVSREIFTSDTHNFLSRFLVWMCLESHYQAEPVCLSFFQDLKNGEQRHQVQILEHRWVARWLSNRANAFHEMSVNSLCSMLTTVSGFFISMLSISSSMSMVYFGMSASHGFTGAPEQTESFPSSSWYTLILALAYSISRCMFTISFPSSIFFLFDFNFFFHDQLSKPCFWQFLSWRRSSGFRWFKQFNWKSF